jgi:hypothetical protein
MALPAVDFAEIKATAQEAIALYGTTASFTEQGAPVGRPVKCVVYRDTDPLALVQDVNGEPAKALLSPADFVAPLRFPQQFDTLTVDIEGFKRIYAIADVHPVLAENRLALIIATLKAN